ncbi:MAG: hypothetical protein A3G81_04165 [Betaproteobacteria bacterium RIFCSPLOWO2_12_FULL_65_14]|nr:MAG: hypothetical protein A3G81_04165 [Betaproteobacteria bacterium RIFCSPLOWO2_12_FULL_65_14]
MTLAKYLVFTTAALAVGSAYADTSGADKTAAFKSLDIDGDGLVSKAEAAGNAEVTRAFDRGDRNRDGKLSLAEYERHGKAKPKARTKQTAARKSDGSASAGGTKPKAKEK